jgi:hypothetical protein
MRPHVMSAHTSVMLRSRRNASFMLLVLLVLVLACPQPVKAFCGFYVSSASDEALLNEATTVILMRDGTRTVLSMQNNYRGPARDFAMVVPVPVVLAEGDVQVLDEGVFDRIDRLSSPRLVEYWERDPCEPDYRDDYDPIEEENPLQSSERRRDPDAAEARLDTVVVEARFVVGEYAIEILSAEDSLGLERWLRRNGYTIPAHAAELLEPYVQAGSKFLVAKVRARQLRFDRHGRVRLSPLRIHYDSPEFSLPIRLGLINAEGPQDLIVHILAPGLRYETSNYDTVPIPTNVDVEPDTAAHFGQFYAALFDRTLAANPGAVVLEYAWGQPSRNRSRTAIKCDPCPDGLTGLLFDDLLSLGLDLLPRYRDGFVNGRVDRELIPLLPGDFVHTRLHARYEPGDRVDDLVFHGTGAAYGGNEGDYEFRRPELSQREGSRFQARYAIRHAWAGPITCDDPIRGRWDGQASGRMRSADELAFVDRNVELADFVSQDELDAIDEHLARGGLPKLRLDADLHAPPPLEPPTLGPEANGCGHCEAHAGDGSRSGRVIGLAVLLLSLGLTSRRRRAGARD